MDWGSCLEKVKDAKGQIVASVATLNCFPVVFEKFIFAALIFAGATAVIVIIIGGIKYLLSGGDAKKVEGAKKTITFAIIGLIIVLSAAFIVSLVADITGVGCIKFANISLNNLSACK